MCAALAITPRQFRRQRQAWERAGVLVEALPRIGRAKFLAAPVLAYTTGQTRQQIVTQHIRRSA